MHKKLFKLILIAVPFLILFGLFFLLDYFFNEPRDYALNKEMLLLVKELDGYKKEHGKYPATIIEARQSDQLCVTYIYSKCQKVYYKPINNNQDFRLAMHSFTWAVLWYRKEYCVDPSEGVPGYFFCAAYPEGSKPQGTAGFPVYREDKKIFDNPDEWPELK